MHTRKIATALWVILALNLSVTLLRFWLAYSTHSASIAADMVHAATDSSANIVALFGLWKAAKPPDKEHPWGHQKYETMALLGIGLLILFASFQVLERTYGRIVGGGGTPLFSHTAFWLLVLTIGINTVVALTERTLSKRWNSALLAADAKHTSTDLFAGAAVLLGFGLTKFGITWVDPLAGIFIIGLIGWLAWPLIHDSIITLVDTAIYDEKEICAVAEEVPGVLGCHAPRNRKGFIDAHIELNPALTVEEAHAICHNVEQALRKRFNASTTVQFEPHGQELDPQ